MKAVMAGASRDEARQPNNRLQRTVRYAARR